jgi:hypothetical protein
MHLTATTYRQLLDGTLDGSEARALAEHLEAACETCEAFLAGRSEVDPLDGAVDAALVSLAATTAPARPGADEGAGNDLEFARIQRALRAPLGPGRVGGRPSLAPRLGLIAAVLLAGLTGVYLVQDRRAGERWDGEKGLAAQAIPLRLRFLVLTPAVGGAPGLEQGVSGQSVPASASLHFQVELGRAANVLLARADARGAPEVFLSTRLPAGRSVVSLDGQPAAYPLASLAGPQRFLALASEAPLGPADAARAAGLGGAAARGDGGPVISLDVVEVQVRP